MKKKISTLIVNHRKIILILMVIAAGICVSTIGKTRINYDLTKY